MKGMFKKKKWIKIALLAVVILVTSFGSAYAAANLEPINAFLNKGVKFVVKGDLWQPKDAAGKPMTAIEYNGYNYLPVRAISEALKVPVDYDDASQTIFIGGKPGDKMPILAVPMEVSSDAYVIQSKDPAETLVKGKQYAEVLKIDQYGDVTFTINRKYTRLVLEAAVISPGEHEVEFTLYNAGTAAGNTDSIVLEKHSVNPEDGVKQLTFNVEGLEKIKIHVQSPNLNPFIYARILDTSYFDNGK